MDQQSGPFTRNRRGDALAEAALGQDPGQGHDGPHNSDLEDKVASLEIGRIVQDAGSVVDEAPLLDPPDDADGSEHPDDAVDGADSVAPEGEQVPPVYAPGHGSAMSLASSRHNSPPAAGASGGEGNSSERGRGMPKSLPPQLRTTPHLLLLHKSRRTT